LSKNRHHEKEGTEKWLNSQNLNVKSVNTFGLQESKNLKNALTVGLNLTFTEVKTMSEEIKDREERFANNDLWNQSGGLIEKAHQSAPRDTSIEACEEWRKQKISEIMFQQMLKTYKLARPLVSYIAKYDLPDIDILPMPEELIKALKSMSNYQTKNDLEEFIRCKIALGRATDQYEKWLSQISEAERQGIHEICITFEPHTGGSKNWILHSNQIQKFKKETADKKAIVEELQKYYYDKLIPAFEQELKNRDNSEKVKEIIAEANKIAKEHKGLTPKVTKALTEFGEAQSFKNAKIFIEGRERMRIIEDKICTLSHELDFYKTSPETTLPTLGNVTSDRLQYRNGSAKGAIIKKLEIFFKKEIEREEADTKA
jgi:hypothetical protein